MSIRERRSVLKHINTSEDNKFELNQDRYYDTKGYKTNMLPVLNTILKELRQLGRVGINMAAGNGTKMGYIFVPAVISVIWLIVCLYTTRNAPISLYDRLRSRNHLKDYLDPQIYNAAIMDNIDTQQVITMPFGESVHIAMSIPFLDKNPIAAHEYLKTLEWILIYSNVPITFHIITNNASIPYLEHIFKRINKTSNCDFGIRYMTHTHIMENVINKNGLCSNLFKAHEEFCEIIVGRMIPLLFPYLFQHLDHIIYLERTLVFQDDIGQLWNILQQKLKKQPQGLAMAPEQTLKYMRAFGTWQRINPSTRLGRKPPEGLPGYNPDLMLMDLDKLRASSKYREYFNERKVQSLIKSYQYIGWKSNTLDLGDMINLMSADLSTLVMPLGCEWNRRVGETTTDSLEKEFNSCRAEKIRVWNGNPNMIV